jgi:hypothetical protein
LIEHDLRANALSAGDASSHDERIELVLQPARALAKRRGELADVRFDEYKIDGRQRSLLGGEA